MLNWEEPANALVAALAVGLCTAVMAGPPASAESVVVPNHGFVRSVCDQSEAQYVVSGRLHIVSMGSHLNGQAIKGIGVEAVYDAQGNPVPVDADGNPIAVDPQSGMPVDPSALVPTGTKYVGNFRDNTQTHTRPDGTIWYHFTGGSVINGTNGTHEVNGANVSAIFPAGTTDFDNTEPLQVLQNQFRSSCRVNGTVIYDVHQ